MKKKGIFKTELTTAVCSRIYFFLLHDNNNNQFILLFILCIRNNHSYMKGGHKVSVPVQQGCEFSFQW